MKYIAYGSNMAQDQMARRCPDAKLIGTGYLEHTKLEFYLHATVERSQAKDVRVPVAVWEISKADEERLDVYEAFPAITSRPSARYGSMKRTSRPDKWTRGKKKEESFLIG